jgi:hypothetical protein
MIEHLLSFVTVGSVCIAALATYITVRNNNRQLGAQIFLAYSNRVREIRQAAVLNTPDIEVTLSATFLIFELYELRRRGYVSSAIWSIWDRDIGDLLRTDNFQAQWETLRDRLRNHVRSHGHFCVKGSGSTFHRSTPRSCFRCPGLSPIS